MHRYGPRDNGRGTISCSELRRPHSEHKRHDRLQAQEEAHSFGVVIATRPQEERPSEQSTRDGVRGQDYDRAAAPRRQPVVAATPVEV